MDTAIVLVTWLGGILSGGLLCLGLIEVVTGRAVFNLSRKTYSATANRLLGACTVVQATALALWALIGALILGTHTIPVFWAASFSVVFFGATLLQGYVLLRQENPRSTVRK